MPDSPATESLPDASARLAALTDHDHTLLVEAGAGSGKTALMAGRVVLLVAGGVPPKEIAAITFTEAAASELLERIERFVRMLLEGQMPLELEDALPDGLSVKQRAHLQDGASAFDEITCTTIHGFCQQLIKPYPVETGIDPGAKIIDPAAAELAYQDLMEAWLSARFGRDRGAEGLGRIPPITDSGGEEDFFAELLVKAPDDTLDLIQKTAQFLKVHRIAQASAAVINPAEFTALADTLSACAAWYNDCGVVEPTTAEFIEDLTLIADLAREAGAQPLTGRRIVTLLFHTHPKACKKDDIAFKQWGRKGKWKDAAKATGLSAAQGEQLSTTGEGHYQACGEAYRSFCAGLGALAFQHFVGEFGALRNLYREYKREAALLDFDDLLHHARDLLKTNEAVRRALARRYPRILVDEFQDTDPLQAEILWRIAGDGEPESAWHENVIRSGALFLVGDPKQAIYRFRGADVETYLVAKRALEQQDPSAILNITASFRAQRPILEFVNTHFAEMLDEARGQPGFTALSPVRPAGDELAVSAFEVALDDRHKNDKGKLIVDRVRREEAATLAEIISRLIGNYRVWDKGQQSFRPVRAGEIALLAPTGTSLWIYEQALENREVPIATQAGKGFFRRQEVQDLIAIARTIADRRDTLAFGALLRGPLVGVTEEEIADEIEALLEGAEHTRRLNLWTDPTLINHSVLQQTLTVLQNLARKARHATPYQLLAEAIEELHIRPILKARHPRGAERALANVELVLEMARAYGGRGIGDFARALSRRWEDGDTQVEGRPDAEADAVSIITMHSSKGLEWPIVIPINSTTNLWSDTSFLYRRQDDSVHFKVFNFPSLDYETVSNEESEELRRERVRLWYVALTRARDLLLVPKQSERISGDWLSLIDIDIETLPVFDPTRFDGLPPQPSPDGNNAQDTATWEAEAATITATQRYISWHQPSRHEGSQGPLDSEEEIFTGADAVTESIPNPADEARVQGGRERGLILHKLMEEVLTGETAQDEAALRARAAELLTQLGLADTDDASFGPSSMEIAATADRALQLPEIVELRSRLSPEFRVYAGTAEAQNLTLTAGIADAVAANEAGYIEVVVDWKSDVNPGQPQMALYRDQVRDYLAATGAQRGLIVLMTLGRVEEVHADGS